uniref:RNA-directed DNA polymerase n=2 Tax=Strongyloides stercoralis TaxID=6248 RepID=A0A0K0ETN2_STRER
MKLRHLTNLVNQISWKRGENTRKKILQLAHDKNGHFGYKKMKQLIESRVNDIDDLSNKIKLYIKDCEVCQRRNICMKRIPEYKSVIFESPGQNLCADIMGPVTPVAADGTKYVLSVMDSFSRYCYIIPLKSYNFDELAPALMNKVFCYHGFPKTLRTDGGGNFRSDEFQKWLNKLNIIHEMSSPHHSEGNCLVERSFKWIADTVAKIARERPTLWPDFLPMVMFNYNSTVNSTTGSSPFLLTHLREPNCYLDQFLGTYSTGIFDSSRTTYDMLEKAAIIRKTAKEAMEATRNIENKKYKYDSIPKFESDDLILIKNADSDKDVGSKFKLLYQGPFMVIQQKGERIYYKKSKNGKTLCAHISNVKPYFKGCFDDYLSNIQKDAYSGKGEVRF